MIHDVNYFLIICLDWVIIELENSTLHLRFISGSNITTDTSQQVFSIVRIRRLIVLYSEFAARLNYYD